MASADVIPCHAMARLRIEAETGRSSLEEMRGEIDAMIAKHFPAGLLEGRWDGDVLRLRGPGARGTMVFDTGRLRVEARLKPPASLLRTVIEQKIKAAFADALGWEAIVEPA